METKRQLKISRLIYREMSEIFQLELKTQGSSALVTVTKVTVTPDLYTARVYLSIFATKNKTAKLEQIKARQSEIRGLLGQRVRHQLRSIPKLEFFVDDSLDYIEKIDNLLKGE